MHPEVRKGFEWLLAPWGPWTSVLEIGTPKDPEQSLLFLPLLEGAHRKGIDLTGPYQVRDIYVQKANAGLLPFPEGAFDLVLCNSVLEHEPRFWRILDEVRRVLSPRGTFAVGVPGFSRKGSQGRTETLHYHGFPEDYYRFSDAAVRDVFLQGYDDATILEVMQPPRFVGVGRKPV
jgi:SAM-dependent methyltransferase